MRPIRWALLTSVLFLIPMPLAGQFYPQGAQAISYFPQLVVGGPAGASWSTSMTFVNSDASSESGAMAFFYGDNGAPLALDFGNGPAPTLTFSVAPQGSITLKTAQGASSTLSGWAVVVSSLPLEGIVQYTLSAGGIPQQSISVQATAASSLFRSPATANTGIAAGNPYTNSLPITISAVDAAGHTVSTSSQTLPPLGHRAFNVSGIFPSLPASFQGTVTISGPADFVALTISANGAALSSYPPSGMNWPASQTEVIYKVWSEVLDSAEGLVTLNPPPTLVIDDTMTAINAYADSSANEVHIFLNLAELISDSESELAFVIGHELGHIIQSKTGLQLVPGNAEEDADELGMLLALGGGYDPYGAAGALAKLSMISSAVGLLNQNFDNMQVPVGTDYRTLFNNRLALVFQDMKTICDTTDLQDTCTSYKTSIHPHFPGAAPLETHAGWKFPTGHQLK